MDKDYDFNKIVAIVKINTPTLYYCSQISPRILEMPF